MAWANNFDYKIANGIKFMHVCNKEVYYETCEQTSCDLQPRVQIFGDVGHGKSTQGNYILKESLVDKKASKIPTSGWFKTKRQLSAVTKQMKFEKTDTINLIDTCGFNDMNPSKTNELSSIEILSACRSIFTKNSYINGFIFCILMKRNLVVEKKSIDTLYNMLSSLGYIQSYLDLIEKSDENNFDYIQIPFIKIVVNNFSKSFGGIKPGDVKVHTPRDNLDSGRSSPMTNGTPERTHKTGNSPSPNRNTSNKFLNIQNSIDFSTSDNTNPKNEQRSEIEFVTSDTIKQTIKNLLAEKITEIHNIDTQTAIKIVEHLLSDKCFYFFKANIENKKRKKAEKLEIKSLIYDILSSSNSYTMDFLHAGNLKPILRSFDDVKYLQDFFCEKINLMLQYLINFRTNLIESVNKTMTITNLPYSDQNTQIENELYNLLEAIFCVNNYELTVAERVEKINNPCILKDNINIKKDFWIKVDRKLLLHLNEHINHLFDEIKKNILIQISMIYNNLIVFHKQDNLTMDTHLTPNDWKVETDKFLRNCEESVFKVEFDYEKILSIISEESYKMVQETHEDFQGILKCNDLKVDQLLESTIICKTKPSRQAPPTKNECFTESNHRISDFDTHEMESKKTTQKDLLIKNILLNDLYKENELLQSEMFPKKRKDDCGQLSFCSGWGFQFCLPSKNNKQPKYNGTENYDSQIKTSDRDDDATFDISRNFQGHDDSLKILETNLERNFASGRRLNNELINSNISANGIVEAGNVHLAIKKSDIFISKSIQNMMETDKKKNVQKEILLKENQVHDSNCKIY